MKNLKKLSRKDLKAINGSGIGNCGNACSQGDGFCEQYGLSCFIHVLEAPDTGEITSYCWKCT